MARPSFMATCALVAWLLGGCTMTATQHQREERMRRSSAWRDGIFVNATPTEVMPNGGAGRVFARFFFESADREPAGPLETAVVDLAALQVPPPDQVRATWLGHSTVYVELEGLRILCDPMWSERSSPVGFAGPRRFQPVPVALSDLPTPDLVVISHDHFDHLDRPAVEALAARGVRIAVPLGVGARLEDWGVAPEAIIELDWWERAEIVPGRLAIVATPARHFSGRGLFDRNTTLWTSWVIEGPTQRVYFGGDGGLDPAFQEIGKRFGPFALTMLEIGAFDSAWGEIHLGPQHAVVAHRLLGGKVLLPIHWGTFNLGLHAWYAPPEELLQAVVGYDTELALPRIGQTIVVGTALPIEPWWRAQMPVVKP
jgi:L-ascorbate metabolism protein UlaG (beta-lactamase superfamily)